MTVLGQVIPDTRYHLYVAHSESPAMAMDFELLNGISANLRGLFEVCCAAKALQTPEQILEHLESLGITSQVRARLEPVEGGFKLADFVLPIGRASYLGDLYLELQYEGEAKVVPQSLLTLVDENKYDIAKLVLGRRGTQ